MRSVVELAFGLPAAGALLVSIFRRRRSVAVVAGIAFGVAGLLVLGLLTPGTQAGSFGLELQIAAPVQVVLVATFAAAGLAVLMVPPGADRVPLLASVLTGLAGITAVATLTDPLLAAIVLLVLAAAQAAVPALRSFPDRLRAPAFGALLIAFGGMVAQGAASRPITRLAGLALVLGVTTVIGVAPFLQGLDPREPAPASPIAWLGFLGPALAAVLATRLVLLVPADGAAVYSGVLLGLGIVNLILGAFGTWQAKAGADLWRYSFVADWGLVLVALSMGSGAAYLLLLGILLLRLPMYLLARPALVRGEAPSQPRPLMLLIAAALAGAAPFAGFPARLLILRGASAEAWPLALLLVLAMITWLPQSIRLAQTLGRPTRAVAAGIGLVLTANLVLGLYPNAVLGMLGR